MKKPFFCSILCLSLATVAYAQQLTNYERRHMNDKLLEAIISYENYASFSESHMQYSFVDLFASADVPVFCDYIAACNFGKQISASEYALYSTEIIRVKFVEVRNLKKSDYRLRGGKYVVTVEFDKCLEYEDELNTYFTTTDETIGGDYHITMEYEFDEEENRFYITLLSGEANKNSTFPSGEFLVVERKNDRDELLKVNDRPIAFNIFRDAYIKGNTTPFIDDEDIIIKANIIGSSDRYSKINYSYKETRLRFRTGITIAPISAYIVNSPVSFTRNRSSLYEASADLGYALPIGAKSKLAIYIGLGISHSSLNLSVKNLNYNYTLSDPSSITYLRHYQLNVVKEGLSFVDVLIPGYASYEMSVGDKIALSFDAGIKLYLNANTIVHPYSVDGNVSSIYGEQVRTTQDLPNTINQYMIPASYMRNTYDIATFGKLGVEYKVKDRRYFYLKVGYMHGLTESYKSTLNEWFNDSEGIYPFVYSAKSNSDIAVRSFADCISYKRSAFTFDFGFRIKF